MPQLWPFSTFCMSLVECCLGTFYSLDPTPNTPSLIITHHCWGQKESLVKPHTGVFPPPRTTPHLHKFTYVHAHTHWQTHRNVLHLCCINTWPLALTCSRFHSRGRERSVPSPCPLTCLLEVWDCPTKGPVTHLLSVIKVYSGLCTCLNCPPSSGLGLSIATCELWRTGTLALVKFMRTATFSSWPTSLNRPIAL